MPVTQIRGRGDHGTNGIERRQLESANFVFKRRRYIIGDRSTEAGTDFVSNFEALRKV